MSYAANTSVSVDKTQADIKSVLRRYGADQFAFFDAPDRAILAFVIKRKNDLSLQVKLELPLPDRETFRYTPAKRLRRDDADTAKAWEQGCRSAWRSLYLVVKAKLEAVEAGIRTLEQEFLYDLVTSSGQTVGELIQHDVSRLIESGRVPPLLPAPGDI